MTSGIETLITALYVKIDNEYRGGKRFGRLPKLSACELLCPAVAQALLGHRSQCRWMRYATKHLTGMFPYLPTRSAYNKRLCSALPLVKRIIRDPARDSDFWFDNHWIVDSTPVRARCPDRRSRARPVGPCQHQAGRAGSLDGDVGGRRRPDRRTRNHPADRDKGFASTAFEKEPAERGITLLRPSRKREKTRFGELMLKKIRQLSGSVNDTLKGNFSNPSRTCAPQCAEVCPCGQIAVRAS
jgi:hypothetical protein